jgi:hypothetical protein
MHTPDRSYQNNNLRTCANTDNKVHKLVTIFAGYLDSFTVIINISNFYLIPGLPALDY